MKTFNPKDAKPHERHNRARGALIGYMKEAGLDQSYITGISNASVIRGMLVDLQLMLVEMHGERERMLCESGGIEYSPHFPNHPDAEGLKFIANIGFQDIYRGAETTGYTFIVITGKEGGEYTTTNNLLRLMPGFFDTER